MKFWWRLRKRDEELEKEIQHHLRMAAADRVERGAAPHDAESAARREFGNVGLMKEMARDVWGWRWLENLFEDLCYGTRTLRKNPGFAIVAVLTLALGIGANTAIFTFVESLLMQTLPVDSPSELVLINPIDSHHGSLGFSYPLFEAIRDQNRTLTGIFVRTGGPINVDVDGQAELAPGGGEYVSGSYFSTLGVGTVAGRTFTAAEDGVAGQNPVAVISYGYWKRRFALSPTAIGKKIYLNGFPFTIIGVTSPRFFGVGIGRSPDVTVPITMYPQLNPGSTELSNPGSWWLDTIARLRPGVSTAQATADLSVILERCLSTNGPAMGLSAKNISIGLEPGAWGLSPRSKSRVWAVATLLMTLVGLVLLVACTNVANLLLARGVARQKEIAVRLSIGAGRGRLIRQLVTESLLLAVLGGAAGFLLSYCGTQGLLKLAPQQVYLNLAPDLRVFVFAAGISLLAGVLFGLMPAWRATRIGLVPGLHGGARQGQRQSSENRNRLRNGLVVSQVLLSLVLVFMAGLFTHSLQELLNVELGFRPEHVLVFSVDPTLIGYQGQSLRGLYKDLLVHAERVPGVMAVSVSRYGLLTRGGWTNGVAVPGYTAPPGEVLDSAFNPVGPGFFRTAGIPLLLGRDFSDQDNEIAPKVAIVNETFARQFFGEQSGVQRAVGRTIGLGVDQNLGQFQIVGVVKDSKQRRLDEAPSRVVYFPFLQADLPSSLMSHMTFEVRTANEPGAMMNTIRQELLAVEKNLPIYGVKTLTEQVRESLAEPRMIAWLASLFGSLALLLASVGLYGLIAYHTVRRTGEIGIRMALGARRREVVALVVKEALRLTAVGVVLGLAIAVAAGRAVSGMLYGVRAADPLTILGASLLMFSAAALACFVPARRATKVDPVVALRYE